MSDEKRNTWTRNNYGYYREWVNILCIVLFVCAIMIVIVGLCVGIGAIAVNKEVKIFNSIHETEYTFGEWFWAGEAIKEYHLGKVMNVNLKTDQLGDILE